MPGLDCRREALRLSQALGFAGPGHGETDARHAVQWARGDLRCAETYRAVLAAVGTTVSAEAPEDGETSGGYFFALLQALRAQPPERRAALALLAVEGLKPAEAGAVLGREAEEVRLLANGARDAVLAVAGARGARILVAEDERIAAFELREVLRRFGYTVVALATNAEEALARAEAERPDLALVDVRLRGGGDGINAMRRMRREAGVPAIIITAFGDQRDRAVGPEAAEEGVQAYGFLVKPWGEGELRVAVADALIRIAAERAAGGPHAPGAPADAAV